MDIRWLLVGLGFVLISNQSASGFQWESTADRYMISNFGVNEGLPTKTVTDISMGKDGYLYLASVNGLVRLDGIHTEVFDSRTNPELLSERISRIFPLSTNTQLVMDHKGILYTFKKGHFELIINPVSEEPFEVRAIHKHSENAYLAADLKTVNLIYHDSISVLAPSLSSFEIWDTQYVSGTVYILNTNGLYFFDGSQYNALPFPENLKPDLNLHSSLTTIDGHMKVKGSRKSACYNTENRSWCNDHSFILQNKNEEIYQINDHDSGGYLVVTSENIYKQAPDGELEPYKKEGGLRYENIFSTSYGEVLVHRYGVYINDEEIFSSSSPLVDAATDNSENIWVSTKHNGIYKISKNKFTNHYNDFLINSYSIGKDSEGNYWTGSFDNGLTKWNGKQTTYFTEQSKDISSNSIRMIEPLSSGGVLVSSWGQVPFVIKNNDITPLSGFAPLFGSSSNVTEAFYEEVNGTWWLGTLNGLMIKEGAEYKRFYDRTGTTISHITRIIPSSNGYDIYFATADQGVVLLRNNLFHFLSEDLPKSSQHIRDIWVQSSDTLWATSYNSGLQRYTLDNTNPEPKFEVIELSEEEGFKQAGYHRIISDSLGTLWISTNSGLLRISKKGLNKSADLGYIYTNLKWFTERNGLADREFNGGSQSTGFYDEERDRIWFTNIAGLISFNPYSFTHDSLTGTNFSIQNVISNDSAYNTEGLQELVLGKHQRDVRIKYAHISVSDNLTSDIWVKRSDTKKWVKPDQPGEIVINDLSNGRTRIGFSTAPESSEIKHIELIVEPRLLERIEIRLLSGLTFLGLLLFVMNYYRKRNSTASTLSPSAANQDRDFQQTEPTDKLAQFIHDHYHDQNLGVPKMIEELSISRSSLYRTWKEHHQESIGEYINELRLEKATELLKNEKYNITEVAEMTGYSSQSYFTKVFKKKYGVAPSKYTKDN